MLSKRFLMVLVLSSAARIPRFFATNARAVADVFAAKGRPHFNPLICHFPDADAAFAQGHDDEAYEILRNWAAEFPNNGRPYLMLAAIDALHGWTASAAANMAKHRQLMPLSNIAYVVLTYPSTDPGFLAQRERLVSGLRKAGLPEGSK